MLFMKINFCSYSFVLHKLLSLQMRSVMQFMEWVGEDTKCPYCEGLGHITCDLCRGKTMV